MIESEQREEDVADIDYLILSLEKKPDRAKLILVILDYINTCPNPSRRIIHLEKIFLKNFNGVRSTLRSFFTQLKNYKIIIIDFSNSTKPKLVINKGIYFDYFNNQLKLSMADKYVSEECKTAQKEQSEATLIMKNGNIMIKEKQSLNT